MQKHSLIAVAVALFAAGCTMAPQYERPAAPVTATFPTGGVYDTQPGATQPGATQPGTTGARSATTRPRPTSAGANSSSIRACSG